LDKDIQERISEIEVKSGFIPNVFLGLAHRPDEFRAFFQYYDAVMLRDSELTKAEKEMIIVATSAANNCNYCVTAHGALLRIYSKNPMLSEQIATNYRHSDISDRQKVILAFALAVAKSETITDEHFQRLQASNIHDETIWDIAAIVSLFALSNRMAHVMALRANDDFYYMAREKKTPKTDTE
jgi:uncharacterized peroxidase-related enzyme